MSRFTGPLSALDYLSFLVALVLTIWLSSYVAIWLPWAASVVGVAGVTYFAVRLASRWMG